MLLYYLNYYYCLLCRHCDWGLEYADEWDTIPSKSFCIRVLNAILVVTIFSHSKIGTYDLTAKRGI